MVWETTTSGPSPLTQQPILQKTLDRRNKKVERHAVVVPEKAKSTRESPIRNVISHKDVPRHAVSVKTTTSSARNATPTKVNRTTQGPPTDPKNISTHAIEKRRGAKHEWLKMVESERKNIAEEMKHYKFSSANVTLDSLIPEKGGRPVRAVVRMYRVAMVV